MDISKEEAQKSLRQIQTVLKQSRRKFAASATGPILIMWGLIWILGYLITYAYDIEILKPSIWSFYRVTIHDAELFFVWTFLTLGGFVATWLICKLKEPVKSPHDKRFFFFWLFLFVYADIWLALLWPWNLYQMSAFVATLVMFAYVVMGLWFDKFLLWLGLAVTGLIVLGFFLFPSQPAFWLWLATAGGGTLAGTGLYIKICWR